MYATPYYIFLHNVYVSFDTWLYRHIVGIPMGTHYTPIVANLLSYCYKLKRFHVFSF